MIFEYYSGERLDQRDYGSVLDFGGRIAPMKLLIPELGILTK